MYRIMYVHTHILVLQSLSRAVQGLRVHPTFKLDNQLITDSYMPIETMKFLNQRQRTVSLTAKQQPELHICANSPLPSTSHGCLNMQRIALQQRNTELGGFTAFAASKNKPAPCPGRDAISAFKVAQGSHNLERRLR